ncbi:MAG: hypothetical protein PHT36_01825 [Patescibacteria group bacterium]|mgnify:CR=1 FL=1|nr:hypothetical protein [Patescibacteria group bacterium]
MKGEFFGMDPDQFAWMAEAEGESDLIDTREAKINKIVEKIRALKRESPDVDPLCHIDRIIEDQGIGVASLTDGERKIIDREI